MNKNMTFLQHLRKNCIFNVKVESLSKDMVNMLSLSIFKCSEGSFSCIPKPRPCQTYIDQASMHPQHVHKAWPLEMLHTCKLLCSNAGDILEQSNIVKQRLLLSFISPDILTRVPTASHRESRKDSRWLVLKYHPNLERAAKQAIHDFNLSFLCQGLYRASFGNAAPGIRLAWTNSTLKHRNFIFQGLVRAGVSVCV